MRPQKGLRVLRQDMGKMAERTDAHKSAIVGTHGRSKLTAEVEYHALLPFLQFQPETRCREMDCITSAEGREVQHHARNCFTACSDLPSDNAAEVWKGNMKAPVFR
jgi:hypothetical protein